MSAAYVLSTLCLLKRSSTSTTTVSILSATCLLTENHILKHSRQKTAEWDSESWCRSHLKKYSRMFATAVHSAHSWKRVFPLLPAELQSGWLQGATLCHHYHFMNPCRLLLPNQFRWFSSLCPYIDGLYRIVESKIIQLQPAIGRDTSH